MKMNLFSKKVLPMTLAAVMAVAPVQVMAAPASDVAGHWAEAVITEWQEQGLIKGYEDGTFKPGNNITRAEFVTIMNNALGYEDAAALDFTDVVAGNWYYNAVAKAVAAGYVSGYEDGTFKPNNTITRAEAAVMIANAMGLGDRGSVADDFTDAASIPGWAKGSIGAIVEAQYMSGYPDGSFGARNNITRAEAVSALNRVLIGGYSDDMVVTEDDTVVEGGVVAGDLIIDEAVGEGEVYLNDVEVMGDLIVNGGGEDSVYLKNVKVHGKAHVNKAGVRMQMQGKTELPKVEMNAPAKLDADKTFEGKIGEVKITKDLGTTNKVTINVPVVTLVVDAKANIVINAAVETVEINEGAEGVRVEIAKGIKVLKMIVDAIATLAGAGTIEGLEVNVDGVTVNKNLTVEKTEVADGVKAPATVTETTGGGGGGKGSSSSSSKDEVTVEAIEIKVTDDTLINGYVYGELNVDGATFVAPTELCQGGAEEYLADVIEVTTENENAPKLYFTPDVDWGATEMLTTGDEFYVDVVVYVADAEAGTYTYDLSIDADALDVERGYEIVDETVDTTVTLVVPKADEDPTPEVTPEVALIENLVIDISGLYAEATTGSEWVTTMAEFTTSGVEFTTTDVEWTIELRGAVTSALATFADIVSDTISTLKGATEFVVTVVATATDAVFDAKTTVSISGTSDVTAEIEPSADGKTATITLTIPVIENPVETEE